MTRTYRCLSLSAQHDPDLTNDSELQPRRGAGREGGGGGLLFDTCFLLFAVYKCSSPFLPPKIFEGSGQSVYIIVTSDFLNFEEYRFNELKSIVFCGVIPLPRCYFISSPTGATRRTFVALSGSHNTEIPVVCETQIGKIGRNLTFFAPSLAAPCLNPGITIPERRES